MATRSLKVVYRALTGHLLMDCATIEVREYLERSCGSWALAGADGPRNGIQNASRITNNLFRGLCMLVSALEMRLRAQITLLRVLTIGYTVAAAEPRACQELSDRRGKGLPLWIGEAPATTSGLSHSFRLSPWQTAYGIWSYFPLAGQLHQDGHGRSIIAEHSRPAFVRSNFA